jgi:hypothetical protein
MRGDNEISGQLIVLMITRPISTEHGTFSFENPKLSC